MPASSGSINVALLGVERLTTLRLRGNLGGGDGTAETPGSHARGAPDAALQHPHEDAYVQWVKRFILFHGKKHPSERRSTASGVRR